jgi:hypothetical protein
LYACHRSSPAGWEGARSRVGKEGARLCCQRA